MKFQIAPGGSPNPQFFLEVQDVVMSQPILRCYGRKFIDIEGTSDTILIAEMKETVSITYERGTKNVHTKQIAITAGHGPSVRKMDYMPFPVAVLLLLTDEPKSLADLKFFARGSVWLGLPLPCLELLGYS